MGRLEICVYRARNLCDDQARTFPDSYVRGKLNDQWKSVVLFKTDVKRCTANPVWEERFMCHVADTDTERLVFEVWKNNLVVDDLLGTCSLSLSGLTRGVIQDASLPLISDNLSSAELHLRVLALDFGQQPSPGQLTYGSIESALQGRHMHISRSTSSVSSTRTAPHVRDSSVYPPQQPWQQQQQPSVRPAYPKNEAQRHEQPQPVLYAQVPPPQPPAVVIYVNSPQPPPQQFMYGPPPQQQFVYDQHQPPVYPPPQYHSAYLNPFPGAKSFY